MDPAPIERAFELVSAVRTRDGTPCRAGTMRRATPEEEIGALRDFRVFLDRRAFVPVLLSKVTRLGGEPVAVSTLAALEPRDLRTLELVYRELNAYPSEP